MRRGSCTCSRTEGCDVVILDLDSNHSSLEKRVECSRQIAASESASVVMVDDALRATAVELVRLGAHGYCRKPPSVRDLKTMIQRAYENVSLKRKLRSVEQQLAEVSNGCDQMIGCSSPMQQVYDLVHRVASLNASVLIVGESGTGKELIAQAIHNLGSRSDRPFVAVSCGAIPETLIESELFGHEKGAFTGTVGSREGYLEQAGDGTLFLDEVGEITLSTQVKLLRVLQQREFSRLGSSRLIPLRARIIFATHQDLGEMVQQGKFRQDLYYRINVMRIDAPSLQEHAEDIPTIAHALSTAILGDVRKADRVHRSGGDGGSAKLLLARQCTRVGKYNSAGDHRCQRLVYSGARPAAEYPGRKCCQHHGSPS